MDSQPSFFFFLSKSKKPNIKSNAGVKFAPAQIILTHENLLISFHTISCKGRWKHRSSTQMRAIEMESGNIVSQHNYSIAEILKARLFFSHVSKKILKEFLIKKFKRNFIFFIMKK